MYIHSIAISGQAVKRYFRSISGSARARFLGDWLGDMVSLLKSRCESGKIPPYQWHKDVRAISCGNMGALGFFLCLEAENG